jgi:WD40 repeat protein/energy-coupling factor transporter ATP-binding protein EcfA2
MFKNGGKIMPSPFIGLRSYRQEENDIFFGRDDYSEQLVEELANHKFITVIGTSGAGKSSLVKAGLLPHLILGLVHGSNWRVATFRPGSQPFWEAANALLNALSLDIEQAEQRVPRPESLDDIQKLETFATYLSPEDLLRQTGSLAPILKNILENILSDNYNLLIVVDQFEELFRYTKEKEIVKQFIKWLLDTKEYPKAYVLITIRSEFLETDCASFPKLAEAINEGHFLVPALLPEQIRETIELPPRLFDGEVEEALVNQLLNDIDQARHSDQLPLLQYVLMRMWLHFQALPPGQRILTKTYYDELGGLEGALTGSAEIAYQDLNEDQRRIAKTLFQCITQRDIQRHPDGNYEYSRHPTPIQEIAKRAEVTWEKVSIVIERFRDERHRFLLPPLEENLCDTSDIDITHESLIRQWPQLKNWADEEGNNADIYKRLEDASRHFPREASLWRGPELKTAIDLRKSFSSDEQFKNWAKRYGRREGQYFKQAFGFLESSWKLQRHEEKLQRRREKTERWKEELRIRSEEKLKHKRAVANVAATAAVVFFVLMLWAILEQIEIYYLKNQRTEQLFASRRVHAALAAQTQEYAQATQILNHTEELASEITDPPLIHSRNLLASLLRITSGKPENTLGSVNTILLDLAVSSDGTLVVATGENGTVARFDVKNKSLLGYCQGHQGNVKSVVFEPDGKWFATAGADKQIILWTVDGEQKQSWSTDTAVESLAISQDGLIAVAEQQKITLWEVETGTLRILKESIESEISGLAFSPTEPHLLATASGDGTAQLWQIDSGHGQLQYTLKGHTDKVQGVAFSPNGQLLATSSNDKTIRLWQVATGESMGNPLRGHTNKVYGLDFLSNERLVSSSEDSTLRIWDVNSGITLRVLSGHSGPSVAVTHQQDWLLSAGHDGSVYRWQTTLPYQYLIDLSVELSAVALSLDNQKVAVGTADGTLTIYSVPAAKVLMKQPAAHKDDILRLNFSPTGQQLASASSDNTAKIWTVEQSSLQLNTTITHQATVNDVIFTPNGQQVITASYDGQVGITHLSTNTTDWHKLHGGKDINAVALDQTGERLMTASDQELRIWSLADLSANNPMLLYTLPQNSVIWGSLSKDAKYVASMGRDSMVKVYQPYQIEAPKYVLSGHTNTIYRGIFSPDNQQLITGSADGTLRFWDLWPREEFKDNELLFTLSLPAKPRPPEPFYDFDFHCTGSGSCWIAVPLTNGRLMLYDLGIIYSSKH